MKIVVSTERAFLPALKKVVSRGRVQGAAVEKTVKAILQAVEWGGDRSEERRGGERCRYGWWPDN